jgi:hypothetical protein
LFPPWKEGLSVRTEEEKKPIREWRKSFLDYIDILFFSRYVEERKVGGLVWFFL